MHSDVKPVDYALVKVELGTAHGVAAIGEKGARLIRAKIYRTGGGIRLATRSE
jgi:hypothetical protein